MAPEDPPSPTPAFRSRDLWTPVAEAEDHIAAVASREPRRTLGTFLLGTGLLSFAFSRRQKVKSAVRATFNWDLWRALFVLTGTGLLASTLESGSRFGSDVPQKSHSTRKGKAVAKFSFEVYNVDQAPEVAALKSVSSGEWAEG